MRWPWRVKVNSVNTGIDVGVNVTLSPAAEMATEVSHKSQQNKENVPSQWAVIL